MLRMMVAFIMMCVASGHGRVLVVAVFSMFVVVVIGIAMMMMCMRAARSRSGERLVLFRSHAGQLL